MAGMATRVALPLAPRAQVWDTSGVLALSLLPLGLSLTWGPVGQPLPSCSQPCSWQGGAGWGVAGECPGSVLAISELLPGC